MKTILITGAAGFIGSHLCDFFLKHNKVIGIDNFITGSRKNISHLDNENFTFIEHDICKQLRIQKKIDYILHFASPASPVDYIKYPIETLRTNSLGTENILKLGLKNNATVLVASTSEVYGDPLIHPQNESYFGNVNPIGPRSVYDEAKRYLEAITMVYNRKKNLNTRIVRIFNTYGPRMRITDGRAIPNFINQCINNEDLTIYGDGSQTRSFCYVSDTVKGINKLLNTNYQNPINIGNPNEFTINELAKKIINILNPETNITYGDLPENDPKLRKPDINLAKRILDWNPKIDIDIGLEKTINHFKNIK